MGERELVLELASGRTRPAVGREPLLSSAGRSWAGILVEEHQLGEVEARDICAVNHVAFLQLEHPAEMEWHGQLPKHSAVFLPGQVSFLPALFPFSARSRNAGRFLTVSLEPAFLACAAAEYGTFAGLQLQPILAEDDPLMRELLGSFRSEVESGNPRGELYAHSLASMLAVHLVEKYSGTRPAQKFSGGLSKPQLLRTANYIREHLARAITIAELAALNGVSLYHFTRLFKRATGVSPYEYVTRLRIEKARELLLKAEGTLTEVALQTGFYDQSHFARHFRRICGTTPAAFSRAARQRKIIL